MKLIYKRATKNKKAQQKWWSGKDARRPKRNINK
jgi:hypothetical protein